MVSQTLPTTIAEAPTHISVPKWQVRNPHVFIRNSKGQVIFYSDGFWNGRTIDIFYVPEANIELYEGNYALHDTYPLQRISSAKIQNGAFTATWNISGHKLPSRFYILAKTNTGSVTIEKVAWKDHQVVISGSESPVQ